MELAKVTAKGQITIPISIRRELGIKDGDKVLFVHRGNLISIENASLAEMFSENVTPRKDIDFRKYGKRTERGQNVEQYMREMRDDDRI